jgi:hypothetical protein
MGAATTTNMTGGKSGSLPPVVVLGPANALLQKLAEP